MKIKQDALAKKKDQLYAAIEKATPEKVVDILRLLNIGIPRV